MIYAIVILVVLAVLFVAGTRSYATRDQWIDRLYYRLFKREESPK
jgi:hypothetical protein